MLKGLLYLIMKVLEFRARYKLSYFSIVYNIISLVLPLNF